MKKRIFLASLLAMACAACGHTPRSQEFYEALLSEDPVRMEAQLAEGADVNDSWLDGWRPLHFSIAQKKVGAAKWLLAHGADANQTAGGGVSALAWAVRMKNDEMAELLLQRGADPCLAKDGAESAVVTAQSYGSPAMVARLGRCPNGR